MRPAKKLCFVSQNDRVEVAGEMVLTLIVLKVDYEYEKEYNVVDVHSSDQSKPTRNFKDLPTKKINIDCGIAAEKTVQ